MNIRILYHSILVLLATVYPVSVPQIMLTFARRYRNKNQDIIYLMNCVIISTALLLLCSFLIPISDKLVITSNIALYIIAVVAAPILIGVEFVVGWLMLKASGTRVKGISVNSSWTKISAVGCILTVLLAVIEEIIYRQLWSVAIIDNLGWNIIVFMFLSAVVYGFNHFYYGFTTFLQKTVSGFIFASLFLLSGRSIVIPIIAHSLQNIIILVMGRCKKNE